jgi:uncharacterized protein (DUF2384 family)
LYNETVKHVEAKPKKALSAKSKLSELRDATGKFGGQFRPDTKPSAVLGVRQKVSDSSRKRPKAPQADTNVTEYAAVLAHAVDTFGSRTRANAWLNRPSRIFNNQSPLQILTQDPAAVEEELVRIDHGMFF